MTAPEPKIKISVEYPKTGTSEPATSNLLTTSGPHEFRLDSADLTDLGPPNVICTEDETGLYDVKLILQKKEPGFNIVLEYPQAGKGPGSTPSFTGPGSHLASLSESADLSGLGNPSVESGLDEFGNFNIKFMLKKRT